LFQLPAGCQAAGAGDCDRDGDVDLLIRCGSAGYFVENCAIHLAPRHAYATIKPNLPGAQDLEVADLNGDSLPDLIANVPSQNKIYWYRGQLGGGFGEPIFALTGGEGAAAMAAGDVDRDGDTDLVYVLPGSGKVTFAPNLNGSGATFSSINVGMLPGVNRIALANTNRDGDLDILVSSGTTGAVRWFNNNGDGSPWGSESMTTLAIPPKCLAVTQLLPSSRAEVVMLTMPANNPGRVSAFDYNLFSNPPWQEMWFVSSGLGTSAAMVLADVNGTGGPDVVWAAGTSTILWGDPALPNGSTSVIGAAPAKVNGLVAADWDRDGRTDILCAHDTGVDLFAREGNAWKRIPIIFGNNAFKDVVALDFNQDGLVDLAALEASSGDIELCLNVSVPVDGDYMPGAGIAERVTVSPSTIQHITGVTVKNPGHPASAATGQSSDPDIAVDRLSVRFNRAVWIGDNNYGWGPELTPAEVQELVSAVSLYLDGVPIATALTLGVTPYGELLLNVPPITEEDTARIPAGQSRDLSVRITLKPGAAQAGYDRFYVRMSPTTVRVLDDADPARTARLFVTPAVMVIVRTLLEQWREDHFGSPVAAGETANDADFDDDGASNLAEYIAGTDPTIPQSDLNSINGLILYPPANHNFPAQARLVLSKTAVTDPRIKVTIQKSTTLGTWTTMAERVGTGAWTGVTPSSTPAYDGSVYYYFNTGAAPAAMPRFFIRLQLAELP
jgi:hypothetical protein